MKATVAYARVFFRAGDDAGATGVSLSAGSLSAFRSFSGSESLSASSPKLAWSSSRRRYSIPESRADFGTKWPFFAADSTASMAYADSHGTASSSPQKPKPPAPVWCVRSSPTASSTLSSILAGMRAPNCRAMSGRTSSGRMRLVSCSVQPYG